MHTRRAVKKLNNLSFFVIEMLELHKLLLKIVWFFGPPQVSNAECMYVAYKIGIFLLTYITFVFLH